MDPLRIILRLTRNDTSTPWGFRLEGGVDLGHALNIQRVTPGSVAERSGLLPGDLVIRINNKDIQFLCHEEAKMEIVRAGNDLEVCVERNPYGVGDYKLVQAKQGLDSSIGSNGSTADKNLNAAPVIRSSTTSVTHSLSPTCFGPPTAGEKLITQTTDGRVRCVGHSSYNSPMGLYSKSHVNESFGSTMSAVGAVTSRTCPSGAAGISSAMRCGACGELIGGVFVKVQNRVPMHPKCLKCCKCNIGLRNIGYFCIKDELYCETHAKQAAPPPERGMKPVIVYK